MINRPSSFRLPGHLALVALGLGAGLLLQNATGTPAPKPKPPYALLFVPKKAILYETIRNRRYQIGLLRDRSVLYAAVRSLKNAHLPSLPQKGKGEGEGDAHEEDVAWMKQNLKIEYLDGTGVLRISLAAGNPREQALLVNAVVHAYFKLEVHRLQRSWEHSLVRRKKLLKSTQEEFETLPEAEKKLMEQVIAEYKSNIERCEFELRTLPQILELADMPPE